MKNTFTIFTLFFLLLNSNDALTKNSTKFDIIDKYFQSIEQNSQNYKLRIKIINSSDTKIATRKLISYTSDSINIDVKNEALDLLSRLSILTNDSALIENTINIFLRETNSTNRYTSDRCIKYLYKFKKNTFTKQNLYNALILLNMKHHAIIKFIKLVGHFGRQKLTNKLLFFKQENENYNDKINWNVNLALARLGNKKAIKYVYNKYNDSKIDDFFVNIILPNILYTRQKQIIEICTKGLNLNCKNCNSPNPNLTTKINCGYKIMRFIAPVIKNIPINLKISGSVKTKDYKLTLSEVITWLKENPNYKIIK